MASLGSPVVTFAALQFRSTRFVGRLSGRAYKILMEMEIWRDRLDHILELAGPSMRAHTGKDAVNMRTGSHK